jgi:hypothetical protein
MKRINTTIEVSVDGKTWSNKMTIDDFIKNCRRGNFKAVKISEVVTQEEAKQLILEGLY